MKAKDISGRKFGRLTAIRTAGKQGGRFLWECRCDCGRQISVTVSNLLNGNTGSCGCISTERISTLRKTHGMSDSHEFSTWAGMIDRCTNPRSEEFKYYGGRGIKVSPEWLSSFRKFYEEMGPKPGPEYSIERKDNDGDYSAQNCRWATRIEQMQNTSRSVRITIDGETHVMAEWARRVGISSSTIELRMKRGMSPRDAVLTPKYPAGCGQPFIDAAARRAAQK